MGLVYGINNETGIPSSEEANSILDLAAKSGIGFLDTAEAYGKSLDTIGEYQKNHDIKFEVLTKVSNYESLLEKITEMLKRSHTPSFESISFHSLNDYLNEETRNKLLKLKHGHYTRSIGLSLYTNEEIEFVIKNKDVDFIQVPFNIFDNSNLRGDLLKRAKDKNILVHVRSVFLQGIFFKNLKTLNPFFKDLIPHIYQLHQLAREANVSPQSICLNYVMNFPYIDRVIFGVEKKVQLENNIKHMGDELDHELFKQINKINIKNVQLLNPKNWP